MTIFPTELTGCIKCGGCQLACPVVAIEGVSRFSGPRSLVADALRCGGRLESLRDNAMMCTTCWRCEEVCPSRLPLPEAILGIRSSIYSPSRMLEGHERMVRQIDLYGRSVEPGDVMRRSHIRESAELLFFPGCISELRMPAIFDSTVDVLVRTSADFGVPEGWVCCGAPLEKAGDRRRMEEMVSRNLKVFRGFQEVVTSCPGCTTQLLQHYGIEPLHTIEYLTERVRLERLEFRDAGGLRVALHHPCHLSRTVGPHTIDQSYRLLSAIPGLEVVELGDPSRCCGGGGGVVAGYPSISRNLARHKMLDFEATGADLLLASCPFCVLNLSRVDPRIEELITFVAKYLR